MKLPLIGKWLQKIWIPPDADANWILPIREAIPIGVDIPRGEQVILPANVVKYLIQRADAVFAMAACPCRTAFQCRNHPWEIGCLHIGPAARNISPRLGRLLSHQEAAIRLQRALDSGLVPTILHMESDAEVLGVAKTKLLSICFCCECCCDVRLLLREGPARYWDSYNHRLPGVTICVNDTCTRCGLCVEACYGGERVIIIGVERAEINDRCLGCGRCVPVCPVGAIELEFDPKIDVFGSLLERISTRTTIDHAGLEPKSPETVSN